MDPVGGVVGGVVEAEHGLVVGGAVRQGPDAVVARLALADFGDGGQEDLVAGLERAGQGGAGVADDLGLLALGDVERAHLGLDVGPERRILAVLERGARDDRAAGRQVRLVGQGGRGETGLGAGAEVGRDFIHHPLDRDQARDIGAGVVRTVDRMLVHQHDGQAAHHAAGLGDHVLVLAVLEQLALLGHALAQQAQRQLALFGQVGALEAAENVGGLTLGHGERVGRALRRVVVQLAVALLQAQARERFRRGPGRFHEGGVQRLDQGRVLRTRRRAVLEGGAGKSRGRGGGGHEAEENGAAVEHGEILRNSGGDLRG